MTSSANEVEIFDFLMSECEHNYRRDVERCALCELTEERDEAREKLRMADYWLANTSEELKQAKYQVRKLTEIARRCWQAAVGLAPHSAHALSDEFPFLKDLPE